MPGKGPAGVVAVVAPSTASHEQCTQLLGTQFDHAGTSNLSFCHLSSPEAVFSGSDPPLCFSQHHLSPKSRPPYFAALSRPLSPGEPRQPSLALWTVVSSMGTACPFAASSAPLRRRCSSGQEGAAASAGAVLGASAPELLRPPWGPPPGPRKRKLGPPARGSAPCSAPGNLVCKQLGRRRRRGKPWAI